MPDFHLEPITWILVALALLCMVAPILPFHSIRIPRSPRVGRPVT